MYCTNGVKQLLLNVVYTLIRETGKLPERRAQTQSFILHYRQSSCQFQVGLINYSLRLVRQKIVAQTMV